MIAEEGCAEALEGPEEKGVLEPEMDTGVCLGSTRALGAGEGGGRLVKTCVWLCALLRHTSMAQAGFEGIDAL